MARVNPNLMDLLIALFSGIAVLLPWVRARLP